MLRTIFTAVVFVAWLTAQPVSAEEVHFIIKPNPALAQQCLSEEGKESYWQSLPDYNRKDIGFQADALKIPFEEYRQSFIIEQCQVARDGIPDNYERTQPLSGLGEWWCKASWDGHCKDDHVAEAPKGMQICKAIYDVKIDTGENKFTSEPSEFLPDVADSHRRFRKLKLIIESTGNGRVLRPERSHFRLANLLITMVPDYWPDTARRKNGCIVPPAPVAAPPPRPTGPTVQPVPATVSQGTADGGHSFRFALANPGAVPTTMGYEVYMTDNSSGERLWGNGVITIQPNTTWQSDGFHNWNAVNWRLRTFMIRP